MKWYIPFLILSLYCDLVCAQQIQDPTDNIPTEQLPPSHNYSDIIQPYGSTIIPAFKREWELEKPVQVGPDLPLIYPDARIKTTYIDGLQRPIQEVFKKASDDDGDVIQLYQYDKIGRQAYTFLPYTLDASTSTGKIDLNPTIGLNNTFNGNPISPSSFQEPFGRTEFDNSPLNKILKTFSPGISWIGSGRFKSLIESTNSQWNVINGSTVVTFTGGYPKWSIGYNISDMPKYEGSYGLNELSRYSAIDEDGNVSETFRDKEGKVVLKIQKINNVVSPNPSDYAYTSYVYDNFGRLRGVLPPLACVPIINGNSVSFDLTEPAWKNLCFQYFYDKKGRQTEKKIPGKEKEYFIFDNWDRIVLRQDGNLRKNHLWAVTIYNAFNNPVITGLWESWLLKDDIQSTVTQTTPIYHPPSLFYYLRNYNSGSAYPTSITDVQILSTTYYSEYTGDLLNFSFDQSAFPIVSEPTYLSPFLRSNRTQNLITGTKVKVLDPDDPNGNHWITTVNYYDKFSRLIQKQSTNIHNGVDIVSTKYTFRGDVYYKAITHRNPEAKLIPSAEGIIDPNYFKTIKLKQTFRLNLGGNGKMWQYQQSINGGPDATIGSYEYGHQGNIKIKNLPALNIFYSYNIRNWISSIRANIFEQYNTPVSFEENIFYDYGFKSKLYNGTISGITWQGNGSTAPKRFYGYSYDPLGRLTHAEFREKVGSGAYNKNENDFTVSNIAYDLNGNIKQMRQRGTDPAGSGPIDMDILSYTYKENSNQLASITDDGQNNTTLPDFKDLVNDSKEYIFDDNGNVVYDGNKEITDVSYNYLNKPSKIEISGKGIVTFVYDAAGNKLQKKVYDQQQSKTTIYDYIENFTYQDNILQFIANDEGRCKPYLVTPDGGFGIPQNFKIGFNYESFVKDHLGNVRQVVSSESIIRKYFASHEIASANVEQLVFENIDLVRDSKPGSTNPDDQMAAHLIAEDPEKRIGTAIMLRVVPGDEFEISADGYYDAEYKEQQTLSGEDVIASLINTLNGGITYSGIPISELPENARIINQTLNNSSLPQLLDQINNTNESPTAPQAHLNYLSFNDKMDLIPENSGKVQIQEATTGWNTIAPQDKITIKEPGYIVIYLSNRSIGTAVYFDRLRINLLRGKVREDNHYYPFGLTLDLLNAGNPPSDKNEIKFQSQKHENDLGLNLYSFRFREHDPQIGRFWQTDPLSESFSYNSPYAFSENKVTSHIELEGLEAFFLGQVPPSIWTRPATIILEENPPIVRPVVEQVVEGTAKTGRFSAEQLKNFERGRTVEAEQLAKNGYEKNTKPFDVEVTPGKNTRTIPDALKNEGKSTVEVKNVGKQSYTRQLKAQEKISNDNGFKPELIINKDAQISKPLQNSSFDIKLYTPPPGGVIDNTGHKVQELRPVKVDPFDYFNQLM